MRGATILMRDYLEVTVGDNIKIQFSRFKNQNRIHINAPKDVPIKTSRLPDDVYQEKLRYQFDKKNKKKAQLKDEQVQTNNASQCS